MENVLASSTSSFDFSRNDKLTGIKMLLKLKNAQKIYDNYIGGNDNPEEYIDEIMKNEKMLNELYEETDNTKEETFAQSKKVDDMNEKSSQMIKDLDIMLKEVIETRRQLQLEKEKSKIKTKEDYLKYMNVKPYKIQTNINQNSPIDIKTENLQKYKEYIIPKDEEKQKKFDSIKEKLNLQKNKVDNIIGRGDKTKQLDIEELNRNIEKANKENYNCGNTFITEEKTNTSETINTNQDDDLNKLFAEIHLANSKMDNFLNEIDECLELNENINTVLENNKEPPKEEKK